MKKNLGSADRIIRLILSAVLVILFLTDIITGTWGIVSLIVAGILILTSIVSFCPLYKILGITTSDKKSKHYGTA